MNRVGFEGGREVSTAVPLERRTLWPRMKRPRSDFLSSANVSQIGLRRGQPSAIRSVMAGCPARGRDHQDPAAHFALRQGQLQSSEKKQRVLEKLTRYFDRFFGLGTVV